VGFRRADVRRALDAVSARNRGEALTTMPVETILREALVVLTSRDVARPLGQDHQRFA
jgi:hypothetical protein